MVVLGPKSRISDVSKPFHIDTVVEEMLKTTPEIIRIDKQIADKKEQMLEELKRTIMWIDGLELEKQHMERLIVFGEDKCMKGKARYLTALENFINGEANQEIRLNGAKTKTPVVDLNPNLESLKSAISKSTNRSGPVICKCENKVLQALDMKKQHLVVKYSRLYTNRIMRKSNVFLCTMSSMWRTKNITTVIIDEAATVADEYMPSVGVCNPKNLIVIGDHKQLVPFTRSKFQPRSFFERVVDNKCHIQMLRVQYRMAPCIGKMVSKIFYKGRLKHGVASKGELRWVDCTSKEEQKGTSKINRGEVKKIVEYVKKIEAKVMVITFYTAQYNLLKQKLGDRVATVDSCQGTEADVVCLSCVRSNDKHDIGFCYNKNRMCVALSRAKKKLIIFGNKNTFSRDYRWKKVLNFV
jgi:superfamily I DNA and/or RNA helicase